MNQVEKAEKGRIELVGLTEKEADEVIKTLPTSVFTQSLRYYLQRFLVGISYANNRFRTMDQDLRPFFQLFHYYQVRLEQEKAPRSSLWTIVCSSNGNALGSNNFLVSGEPTVMTVDRIARYLASNTQQQQTWTITRGTEWAHDETSLQHKNHLIFIESIVGVAQSLLKYLQLDLNEQELTCAMNDMDNILHFLTPESLKTVGTLQQFTGLLFKVATRSDRFYFHPLILLGVNPYGVENNTSPVVESIKHTGSTLLSYLCNRFKMDRNDPSKRIDFDAIHSICTDPLGVAVQNGASHALIQNMLDVGFDVTRYQLSSGDYETNGAHQLILARQRDLIEDERDMNASELVVGADSAMDMGDSDVAVDSDPDVVKEMDLVDDSMPDPLFNP